MGKLNDMIDGDLETFPRQYSKPEAMYQIIFGINNETQIQDVLIHVQLCM